MLIITGGKFGADVAERIGRRHACTRRNATDPVEETLARVGDHDMVLLAVWRPYVELARALDRTCHEAGRPWALAEISGTTMTCGPLFVPSTRAGCYHCLSARMDAHQRTGDRSRVLRQAYAADAELGPLGHSGPMAAIAAAALVEAAHGPGSGRFRKIDVITGTVLETELIPLHDCPRCRPLPDGYVPTARFVETMVPQLEKVLS